jgi:hypothetical protein
MSPTQVVLADAPTTRRRTVGPSGWELAAAVLIAAFLLAEVVQIVVAANGPTLDEAIYVTAGHRTLGA